MILYTWSCSLDCTFRPRYLIKVAGQVFLISRICLMLPQVYLWSTCFVITRTTLNKYYVYWNVLMMLYFVVVEGFKFAAEMFIVANIIGRSSLIMARSYLSLFTVFQQPLFACVTWSCLISTISHTNNMFIITNSEYIVNIKWNYRETTCTRIHYCAFIRPYQVLSLINFANLYLY